MPFGYILKPFNNNILTSTIEIGWYRYQAEQKLRESEKRNKDILSTIPDVMFTIGKDGKVPDEVQAEIASRIWPAKLAGSVQSSVRKAVENDSPETFEYALKRPDRLVYCEARIIRSDSETALVIVRDVTERKQAENELAEYQLNLEKKVEERTEELSAANKILMKEIELREQSEENLRIFSVAINQSPICIVICDSRGVIEHANIKCSQLSGYSEEELLGTNLKEKGNHLFTNPEIWKVVERESKWSGEVTGVSKNGSTYYGHATVSSLVDDKGMVKNYVIRVEDITGIKQEQMEIERIKEKLDSSRIDQINLEMDWREWKDKMMNRNILRTDKSLFRNINNSFTQGAGFGSLITLLGHAFIRCGGV